MYSRGSLMQLTKILEKQKSYYSLINGKLHQTPTIEYYRIVNQYAKSLILDFLDIEVIEENHVLTLETLDYNARFVLDDLTLNQSIDIADKIGIGVEDIFSNPDHMIIEDPDGYEHVFSLQVFETREPRILRQFARIIAKILKLENNQVSHIFVPQEIASNLAGCVFEIQCQTNHGSRCLLIAANNAKVQRLHDFYAAQE
jgi:hypothetical protein